MTPGERAPDPREARNAAEFLACLRALKDWSGLTYRELETRAGEYGEILPRSTMANMLARATVPREELLTSFVRVCGADQAALAEWLTARKRVMARGLYGNPGDAMARGADQGATDPDAGDPDPGHGPAGGPEAGDGTAMSPGPEGRRTPVPEAPGPESGGTEVPTGESGRPDPPSPEPEPEPEPTEPNRRLPASAAPGSAPPTPGNSTVRDVIAGAGTSGAPTATPGRGSVVYQGLEAPAPASASDAGQDVVLGAGGPVTPVPGAEGPDPAAASAPGADAPQGPGSVSRPAGPAFAGPAPKAPVAEASGPGIPGAEPQDAPGPALDWPREPVAPGGEARVPAPGRIRRGIVAGVALAGLGFAGVSFLAVLRDGHGGHPPRMLTAPAAGDVRIRVVGQDLCLGERRGARSGQVHQVPCPGAGVPLYSLKDLGAGRWRIVSDHPDYGPGCSGIPSGGRIPDAAYEDSECGDPSRVEVFVLKPYGESGDPGSAVQGYRIIPAGSATPHSCVTVVGDRTAAWARLAQAPCAPDAAGQLFSFDRR